MFPELAVAAPAPRSLPPPRRRRIPLLAAALAAVAVGSGVTAWVVSQSAKRPPPGRREAAESSPAATPREAAPTSPESATVATPPPNGAPDAEHAAPMPTEPAPEAQTLVDDATLPWGSPTAGPPPNLAYLPPGSQLVLLVRPAEIAADEEGRLFIKALGPMVEATLAAAAKACGQGLDGIQMIQAGWQASATGAGVGGYAMHLREPVNTAAVAAAAGGGKAAALATETVHDGAAFSWWLPTSAGGRVLVVGDPRVVREIVAAEQAAADRPPDGLRAALTPDMERLVAMLDGDRHVTLLGAPHFLLNDGRGMLSGPLTKLLDPLEEFFGEKLQAVALSLHFGPAFYAELDAVATVDMPAKRLAATLGGRISGLADTVEEYCSRLDLHPYGRKLVMRLPAMMRILCDATRAGVESKAVVLNCYLPRHAGHNLALAMELALQQTPGPGGGAAAAAAAPQPATAAAAHPRKMTHTFAKDTLEKSIQMIADEIGVPMEILGPDLQLEGITKNQSFGLEERDKTAAEILRVILMKANPDGKLVYVIRREDGRERIDITTRAAATKRGDTLPPGFEAQPEDTQPATGE
jgi:hypothetical protein